MADTAMTADAPANAPTGGTLFGKLVVVVFMGTVILAECLLAYFWIPSADEVATEVEAKMTEKLHQQLDSPLADESEPVVEFDLGDYSIPAHQPQSNTTLRIDFHLYGTVLEENSTEVEQLFTRHKHRFRDQIIFVIRNSDITELSDPGLGLIKRRILEKSNRLFGEPYLRSIIFSDFSFIEQ